MRICDICHEAKLTTRYLYYREHAVILACTSCITDVKACAFCGYSFHADAIVATSADDRVCVQCRDEFEAALEGETE